MNEKIKKNKWLIAIFILTLGLLLGLAIGIPVSQSRSNLSKANEILEKHILIDGHNDLAYMIRLNFRNNLELFNLTDLTKYNLKGTKNVTHTDLIKLKKGKLGGQFWAVYADCKTTGKDATRHHLEQIDVLKRVIQKYSNTFEFVTTAKEMEEAFKNKKIGSFLGMESAHAIDSSMGLLRIFYSLGVRYMTLTHNCDVPWATNNLVDKKPNASDYGGLNDFGKLVVKEMNRLGMIVDISHVSQATMEDVLDTSKAPVMFSHSSVWSLCNHTRNVKDHILQKLKSNNGVIMINFYNGFLTCSSNATIENAVDHIEYVRNLIGVDHIGIGADYDGVDLMPVGVEDVASYPELFSALIDNGWNTEELVKLAGANILRVIRDNERYAEAVKYTESPSSAEIDVKYLENNPYSENYAKCRNY